MQQRPACETGHRRFTRRPASALDIDETSAEQNTREIKLQYRGTKPRQVVVVNMQNNLRKRYRPSITAAANSDQENVTVDEQ